ncbi:TrmB family transcriptional regulator [Salinarchaeum laminariae]|uniref:TrmB family transcriptional regulator n=1 Tax=Salinarchaeum laminariae TaxID=869888 RepID=UPI0020C02719|nr:TrmB family transcriptional regulator sugar-binding domain-containing protein [Salinarchaeum laminariae]
MDTEELSEVLQAADLSFYQADAYVTLLELGTASATEVARSSEVPDARIYDVLRDLDELGYVELYEQDTFQARATDPETVVSNLTQRANRFESAAEEITDRYEQPTLDSHTVSIVKRFDTVLEAARMFVADADTQIHATLTPDQFEELRDDLAEAKGRGVTVNVTLLYRGDDQELDAPDFQGVCTEVHRRPRPSPFIVTSDLQRTAFASNPAAIEDYGMILENRSFTYVFFWHFLIFMWLPWPVTFSDEPGGTPTRYADVRQFLLEYIQPIREGARVSVEIEGRDTENDQDVTISGVVVDTEYVSEAAAALDSELLELAGTATIVVDDGTERHTVGGWSATFEDVEAKQITVTGLEAAGSESE